MSTQNRKNTCPKDLKKPQKNIIMYKKNHTKKEEKNKEK